MNNITRNGKKWSTPEILRLQREWELLKLSVEEIANLHCRTKRAIEFKLIAEGFATWNAKTGIQKNEQQYYFDFANNLLLATYA